MSTCELAKTLPRQTIWWVNTATGEPVLMGCLSAQPSDALDITEWLNDAAVKKAPRQCQTRYGQRQLGIRCSIGGLRSKSLSGGHLAWK